MENKYIKVPVHNGELLFKMSDVVWVRSQFKFQRDGTPPVEVLVICFISGGETEFEVPMTMTDFMALLT